MDLEEKEGSSPIAEPHLDDAATVPATDLDAPEPEGDRALCPRCGAKLTDPEGLGWCPGCGYCRSLEEEGQALPAAAPAAAKKPSALGASEFGEAMKRMPSWAWPLLVGVAVVLGMSIAADTLLPEDCLARALWSAIQMVLSVIGLIAAQLWAIMIVGEREDGLGARDLFLSARVWRAAFRRLPDTRKAIWLGAWSLTALVCGAAVVGGFNYWLELVQQRRLHLLADKLAGQDTEDTSRTGNEALLPKSNPTPKPDDDNRPATECVVIGYQTDGTTVTGIVVAMAEANRDTLRYAGVVRHGLTPELRAKLMARLSRMKRENPLIPGLTSKGTIWVNPGVFCDVIHPGDKPADGEEPRLKELKE